MEPRADIVIPVYRDVEVTQACLEAVFSCSGGALGQVIVIDDRSPEPGMQPMLDGLSLKRPELVVLRNPENLGFVRSVNLALELRKRDVVILNSDTRVTPGWLEELLAVAALDERIACVSPLSNSASICSVPDFWGETKAEGVPLGSLDLQGLPRCTEMPTGVGFCLLLKRRVLDLIGTFDPAYGRGYNEENDWALRARAQGFLAVRANHALVYHLGSVSFGGERSELDKQNRRILARRFPHFEAEMHQFCAGVESRLASHAVTAQLRGLSVCIDLDGLGQEPDGPAERDAVELVNALRRQTGIHLSARATDPSLTERLQKLDISPPGAGEPGFQLLHCLGFPKDAAELERALKHPGHLVVTAPELQLLDDLERFESMDAYEGWRAVAQLTLRSAQAVFAPSEYAASELARRWGVPVEHMHVVPQAVRVGVDGGADSPRTRERLERLGVRAPFFLFRGDDHPRQNLRLLLAAYARLREGLEAKGTRAPQLILSGRPSGRGGGLFHLPPREWLPKGAQYLGALEPEDVAAVLPRALALVCLAANEDAGQAALEAMAAGSPVIYAAPGALPAVVGDAGVRVEECTAEGVSRLMAELLEPARRASLGAAARGRAKAFTWEATARRAAEAYAAVVRAPPVESLNQRRMAMGLLPILRRSEPPVGWTR